VEFHVKSVLSPLPAALVLAPQPAAAGGKRLCTSQLTVTYGDTF